MFPFLRIGFFNTTGGAPGTPPVVSSIFPPFGSDAGGTAVTLTGTGFTTATAVNFGSPSVPAASFTVVNDTTITATTAAGTVANADAAVTNPSGTGTLSQGFTFLPSSGWTTGLFGDLGLNEHLGAVTSWTDQSPAGNNFTVGSAAPAYFAGAPAYAQFDGSTTQLLSTNTCLTTVAADGSAFSVYAVATTTTLSPYAGSPESVPPVMADHDPLISDNFGYYNLGATSTGFFSYTDTWSSNIYDALADSSLSPGSNSADTSNIQLVVHSLDPAIGGGTQQVDVNSGGTYTNSNASNGVIGFPLTNTFQLGATDFPSFWTGNMYAVFIWNRKLTSGEDAVVRTLFKQYYGITSW